MIILNEYDFSEINLENTVLNIKKKEDTIKEKDNQNLFEDLKLQIDSIIKLEKSIQLKSKKSKQIVISRELDPLKSLMM